MDRLRRQPCQKTFNNNENQNISWNEKCNKVFTTSQLNENEKPVLWLDNKEDKPLLHTSYDVGDLGLKPQQYKNRDSKYSNSQITKGKANFAFMSTSIENAELNSSFEPQFNNLQQGNPAEGLLLDCLITSEAKEEKILNYSFTSSISEPVYQSQNFVSKTVYSKLSIHHYMKTFTSTLRVQNEIQSFKSSSAASSEECTATSDVSNRDTLFNNNTCIAELLEDIYKENFLCSSNISTSKGYSENLGFKHCQKFEETYEEQQYRNLSRIISLDCDSRYNRLTSKYENFPSVNDVQHVANLSGRSAESHRNPENKRFLFENDVHYVVGNSEMIDEAHRNPQVRRFHSENDVLYVASPSGMIAEAQRNPQDRLFPSDIDVHYGSGPSNMSAEAHRNTQDRLFVCSFCGKSFLRKDNLLVHHRKHTGEKNLICDKCGKRFATKSHLNYHLICHLKEKPFDCDICGKRFGRKADLTRHLRIHTGEKPYKCSICGKAFADSGNRSRHYKKIHNKQQTFCENFEKEF